MSIYTSVADEIAAPAKQRLATKQAKKIGLTKSHQGGETYALNASDIQRFARFLILGTENGSFYQDSKSLTRENTKIAQKQFDAGIDPVYELVRISREGLAQKQDAIIYSLALATRSANEKTRALAYEVLPYVCRTLSHLYQFLSFRFSLGGFDNGKWVGKKVKNAKDGERYGDHASSMGLRNALQKWLAAQSDEDLVYQYIKYPVRNDISLRDVLRIARPVPSSTFRKEFYAYVVKDGKSTESLTVTEETIALWTRIGAANVAKREGSRPAVVAESIRRYDLPREAVRTDLLNDLEIWTALLQNMPVTAMVRNLGKMSSVGLFNDPQNKQLVIDRLNDAKRIKGSRIHPLSLFTAMAIYKTGRGFKGDLTWKADARILDALGDAFDLSFKNVEPSGKNILLAIDISGSMSAVAHQSSMTTAAGISGVMSLVILRSEPNVEVIGIDHRIHRNIGLSGSQRPDDAKRTVEQCLRGATDLSLPFTYAEKNPGFDAILLFTDSENGNAGLRKRQEKFCQGAENRRLVLAQMVATRYGWVNASQDWDTVGRKSLEIVGFDPSIGKLTSDFLAERF